MGADNQAKNRQARKLERKQNIRKTHDRILIVSEGEKTEPNYFKEIRNKYRLQTAHVGIEPSGYGTEPMQITQYAENLIMQGDVHKKIKPQAFEQVYIVFDRDEHRTYFDALAYIEELDKKKLLNELGEPVRFYAVASIPCFEFWLLLHFEDIKHWLHRGEVYQKLKAHLPDYEKGKNNTFSATKNNLIKAKNRAKALVQYQEGDDKEKDKKNTQAANRYNDSEAYTHVWVLVEALEALTHKQA